MKDQYHNIFESPDITTFISIVKNTNPRPFLRESDKRVCFVFDQDVSDAIKAFYENVPVPIADFCAKLKLIRSMIFSLRAGGRHGKDE